MTDLRSDTVTAGKVLVCGSIALDLLGRYGGSFDDYQQKFPINALNFSLQLSDLRTSFGGCGMNITYGLKQLGVDVIPLTAAGLNFEDHYREHLEQLDIPTDFIVVDPDYAQCATAIVLSDDHGNQITGFYPGASPSPLRPVPESLPCIDEITMAVLAPEDAPIMLRQARSLHRVGIPIVFDPGQGISEFSREAIRELIALSDYVIANDHEWEIIQLNGKLQPKAVLAEVRQVIVTRAARGVDVYAAGEDPIHVPAVELNTLVEATGSGDAFRAGYVSGLIGGRTPETCARLGCLVAAYNLESPETQRYVFTPAEFEARYQLVWEQSLI